MMGLVDHTVRKGSEDIKDTLILPPMNDEIYRATDGIL
jgi:hypothetical protein